MRVLNALRHRRSSHADALALAATQATVCSTPYGIGDRRTGHDAGAVYELEHVLNALRHRRSSHPAEAKREKQAAYSAQRLTASEIVALRCPLILRALRCAQRLTASEIVARARERAAPLCRHALRCVLNALRHRRSSHTRAFGCGFIRFGTCSTPYGIGDRRTRENMRAKRAQEKVLNALRHRRSSHTSGQVDLAKAGVCSTPYGIGDRRTRLGCHVLGPSLSAQRLTASEIVARVWGRRGHRSKNCAQRLTASEIVARVHPRHGLGPRLVLNALRHRRSSHAAAALASLSSPMCSTPYGIGDRRTKMRTQAKIFKECSTPYGIGDRRTLHVHNDNAADIPVLNALRHRRSSHRKGWRVPPNGSSCAQRLTASEIVAQRVPVSLLHRAFTFTFSRTSPREGGRTDKCREAHGKKLYVNV